MHAVLDSRLKLNYGRPHVHRRCFFGELRQKFIEHHKSPRYTAAVLTENLRNTVIFRLTMKLLVTFSFEHGILLAAWLISFITHIFKKGNPVYANSYHPIALTACTCN